MRRTTAAVTVAAAFAVALAGSPAAAARPEPTATAARSSGPADRPTHREAASEVAFRRATTFALAQLARTDAVLPAGRFPTIAAGTSFWRTSDTSGWLAGFWPGSLWLAYQLDGNPGWVRRAALRQAPLAIRQDDRSTHDLGFLLQTTFGQGLELTGSRADRAVVRRAATALASRWVPTVGALRSWDGPPGQVTVIVDNLMNLDLLFDAASATENTQPRLARHWRAIALQHALTTARWHLRADGSTFHVVRFDQRTGRTVWRGTVQGKGNRSTWARGQAWAVHGFTAAYRETGDPRLLEAARRAAGFAVSQAPADGVPWWDYNAPGTVRDTTAGAVLSAGLLDLARIDPAPVSAARWRAAGLQTLRSLVGRHYLSRGTGAWSVLLHGRHDATYADDGVAYGDYYLLEALIRVQLLTSGRPALTAVSTRRPAPSTRQVDLGRARTISGVSVVWRRGSAAPEAYRIEVSPNGRAGSWTTVRSGVSSGETTRADSALADSVLADTALAETYDVIDQRARVVRVVGTSTSTGASPTAVGAPVSVVVRG